MLTVLLDWCREVQGTRPCEPRQLVEWWYESHFQMYHERGNEGGFAKNRVQRHLKIGGSQIGTCITMTEVWRYSSLWGMDGMEVMRTVVSEPRGWVAQETPTLET